MPENRFSCALVGAASFDADHFSAEHFDKMIAVDGGFSSLCAIGVTPDFALGDFDSLGHVPQGVPIERHPVMKDDSDTALALEWALAHGMREVAVYGALGGRLDHTLATLSALVGAARAGMHAVAVGEGNVVVALAGGMSLEIAAKNTGTFSVFSAPDASCGLTECGPLYEVENATLRNDVTLGLSNEFVGKPVSISLEQGAVVVVLPRMSLSDIRIG